MNFDGKQILSTFVKMEEEVTRYYDGLAENAPDEKSKALFVRMSQEEDKHNRMYSALLEKHGGEMNREFTDEEVEYAKSLIDENITSKHDYDKNMKYADSLLIDRKSVV